MVTFSKDLKRVECITWTEAILCFSVCKIFCIFMYLVLLDFYMKVSSLIVKAFEAFDHITQWSAAGEVLMELDVQTSFYPNAKELYDTS